MRKLQLQEIQSISLRILKEFDRFCRANDLTYYLAWGTLLGAVRHKGFIPWDDDVDVQMPRSDYERFQELWRDHDAYRLWSYHRQKEYFFPYMKLADANTVQVYPGGRRSERGVSIDIFALDGQNVDGKQAEHDFLKTYKWQKNITIRLLGFSVADGKTVKSFVKKAIFGICIKTGFANWTAKKIDARYIKNGDLLSGKLISPNSQYEEKLYGWAKEIFEPASEILFEDATFYAPNDVDGFLKEAYGDYMQLPPENERVQHVQELYLK